jgi:hypothetical protein
MITFDEIRRKDLTESVNEAVEYIREGNAMKDIFRPHSAAQYELIRSVRSLYEQGEIDLHNTFDLHLIESDAGKFGIYEEDIVPLDMPILEEEEGKELNKPKRGGPKKFYVYVKNDKGNVVKVTFGDTSGLKAKIDDPEARKSFAARHKCDQQNDKTTAAYWACRLPYYAKELGLSGGGNFFW